MHWSVAGAPRSNIKKISRLMVRVFLRAPNFQVFGSLAWLSPRRLWFADDGHIERSGRSGDIDPFAVPNRRLVVVGRYIHDPALIARPATIVVALGGHRRDRKTKHQSRSEKVSSHGGSSSGFAVMAPLRLCESLRRRSKIANSPAPRVFCPSRRATSFGFDCVGNTTIFGPRSPIVLIRDS